MHKVNECGPAGAHEPEARSKQLVWKGKEERARGKN
jgi:hypothetical protein